MNEEDEKHAVDDRIIKKQKLAAGNQTIFYLNVGGSHFDVSGSTLTKIPFFQHLQTGAENENGALHLIKDRNNRMFIDRDGPPFADILTYLRNSNCSNSNRDCLDRYTPERLRRLQTEARYYALTELVLFLQEEYVTSPGVKLGIKWVHCQAKGGWWKVVSASSSTNDGDNDNDNDSESNQCLVDFNSVPNSFEVNESSAFLVLFHHESGMPHMDNLSRRYDVLPHLYIQSRAGVDPINGDISVARIGDIDLRTKDKLDKDGVAYGTHTGAEVVEFQKQDKVAISICVPKDAKKGTKNFKNWIKNRGAYIGRNLFHQLTLIKLEFSSSPCRARLERNVSKGHPSRVAHWSELSNDGLVDISTDGTKIFILHTAVYLVCSQVAARYSSVKESPNGIRWPRNGWGMDDEKVWLEQNHGVSKKYRKSLLCFGDKNTEDNDFDNEPLRKENFQLGRMFDILICDKGDELSVRSERNVIMNNNRIPYDTYYPNLRPNPEFMDIIRLQNDTEFRRFRSETNETDENSFVWQSIDYDHLNGTSDCTNSSVFVTIMEDKMSFRFNVSEAEGSISVLVLASFQNMYNGYNDPPINESISLSLDGEPKVVSYRSKDSGHFLHINTVLQVTDESEVGFFHVESQDEEWVESNEYNNFNNSMRESCQSVAFVKIEG